MTENGSASLRDFTIVMFQQEQRKVLITRCILSLSQVFLKKQYRILKYLVTTGNRTQDRLLSYDNQPANKHSYSVFCIFFLKKHVKEREYI